MTDLHPEILALIEAGPLASVEGRFGPESLEEFARRIAAFQQEISERENAALRAELEGVRKDAERYRWLRDNIGYTFDETTATAFLLMPRKQELTAYIDAAIAQGKGEK